MGKLFDFFSKKPIESLEEDYELRKARCRQSVLLKGECSCDYCLENDKLASKLAEISRWLVLDYAQRNKKSLRYGDWLEIVLRASSKVQKHILSEKNKKQ